MAFPLFDLAKRLEAKAQSVRTLRRLADVQSDAHLARDVGLPYRPRPQVRIDRW